MSKEKYTIVTIGGVHNSIAKKTKIKGYTIRVLEIFYPTHEELESWSEKKAQKWISENNKRMEAICNFLNNKNE